jgi:hypothetical protein
VPQETLQTLKMGQPVNLAVPGWLPTPLDVLDGPQAQGNPPSPGSPAAADAGQRWTGRGPRGGPADSAGDRQLGGGQAGGAGDAGVGAASPLMGPGRGGRADYWPPITVSTAVIGNATVVGH